MSEETVLETTTFESTITRIESFEIPQLGTTRDIFVYLPADYEQSEKPYPVLYMHDGQNLFGQTENPDDAWHVDAVMEQLGEQGFPAIVVGVAHAGDARVEYNPFPATQSKGDQYVTFLVETLKPFIDQEFRTIPDRAHTGIVGASMGGLISLYAFFRFPRSLAL